MSPKGEPGTEDAVADEAFCIAMGIYVWQKAKVFSIELWQGH